MRLLIETRWFTLDLSDRRPDARPAPEPRVRASGNGTYEFGYDDRIGFRAPLHDHPEA